MAGLYGRELRKPIPLIHDGDHGGDDFITTLLAIAHPETFNLLGVTTCFGNIPVEVATPNACRAVDYSERGDIVVYQGSAHPWRTPIRPGDNAFGKNGLGGVELPEPLTQPSHIQAVDWMIETLEDSTEKIVLCPTGPFTNIARLIETRPDLAEKIACIVGMGGCFAPQPPHGRQGNISPFAEFNFFMDAEAAYFVLSSGIQVVLFPLDVTHQLVFTRERKALAKEALGNGIGAKWIEVMSAAEKLDSHHFDLGGGVFHDECTLLYLLEPDLFRGSRMKLGVNTDSSSECYGQLTAVTPSASSTGDVFLIEELVDSDRAFSLILESLKRLLNR